MDVTVSTGAGVEATQQARLYRGRFVLLPDGSLHHGTDAAGTWGSRWLPERTRTLSREQVANVWSLAQQLGFADEQRSDDRINLGLVEPGRGEAVWLIALSGRGQQWNFIRRADASQPVDPAVDRLVRELAILAWVADTPEVRGYVSPARYDFGPDPYARYRAGNSDK